MTFVSRWVFTIVSQVALGRFIWRLKKELFQGRYKYPTIVSEEYTLLMITSREISFVQQRTPLQPTHFKNGRNNYSFVQRFNQQKTNKLLP